MESQNRFLEEKIYEQEKPNKGKYLETDSFQYNSQDLDQEQKVDVNPVQVNTQNVNVYVKNEKIDYSGKITGVTILKKNSETVQYVNIFLYFCQKCGLPVFETNSDSSGNFIIEDIPPGYYILCAQLGSNLKCQSYHIKVLPGQSVHQTLMLS
uniref:hypothetical protein n=1 Tax=Acetivibrio cellulolyticus TaxID=35830 RepID=UPI0001E30110|nr:hypothetical protein [Acetivibrio cellulolyticus]